MTNEESEAVERLAEAMRKFVEVVKPMAEITRAFVAALNQFAEATTRTNDEQRFWDAAFVAIVGGNEALDPDEMRTLESGAAEADKMLVERRKRTAPQTPEEPARPSPAPAATTFDGGLVERLTHVARDAFFAKGVTLSELWPTGTPHVVYSQIVRAILSELLQATIGLPTDDELETAHTTATIAACESRATTGIRIADIPRSGYRAIAELVSARVAPILAAKDAERERLNAMCVDAVSNAASAEHRLDLAKERIAELEKQLAEQTNKTDAARLDLVNGKPLKDHLHEMVGERPGTLTAGELWGALVDKFHTQEPPVDATGKTPGQVAYEALPYHDAGDWAKESESERAYYEPMGAAVLRAFGGEALRRVRERIEKSRIDTFAAKQETPAQFAANAAHRCSIEFIDDELAKLEESDHAFVAHCRPDGSVVSVDVAKPRIGRACARCNRLEGMHYDQEARGSTCGMFTEVKP